MSLCSYAARVAVAGIVVGFGSPVATAAPTTRIGEPMCIAGQCRSKVPVSNKGKCVNDCKVTGDACLAKESAKRQSGKDRCWAAYGSCTDTCGDALDR